jgi:hypothetical protein
MDGHSIRRVSRSLPRLDSAFQHLDVGKALLLIFRCLTDSTGFAGSTSIENLGVLAEKLKQRN